MSEMTKIAITKRILIPLITVLFLLMGGFGFLLYKSELKQIFSESQNHLNKIENIFDNQIQEDADLLSSLIDSLEEDPELQKIWLEKDKNSLEKYIEPIFKGFQDNYPVTQLYFIELDRKCFLRAHNPNESGDIIRRFTLDKVKRTEKPTHGIELDDFGMFTLRRIHPWKINGKIVGYIELGENIYHIVPKIKNFLKIDLIFTISKPYLNRIKWEKNLEKIGKKPEWNQLSTNVVIANTFKTTPDNIIDLINKHSDKRKNIWFKIIANGKSYNGKFTPLLDIGKRKIGDIITFNDITSKKKALQAICLILIGSCLGIGTLIFVLFYIYIKRIEKEIIKAHNNLKAEIEIRKKAEQEIAISLKYEKGLALCSQFLLADDKESLSKALTPLLTSFQVDRIYIFENFEDPIEGLCMYKIDEVCDENIEAIKYANNLPHLPYKDNFNRWQKLLSQNIPIYGETKNFPENERIILEKQSIVSTLLLPIKIKNKWFGFIGFDNTIDNHTWTEKEIRILQTATEIIGTYIGDKRAEEEKQKLETQLRQLHKMETIGTLAGGIAHDFNNILSIILGNGDMLLNNLEEDSEQHKKLKKIISAANSAKDLVQQILTFSKQTEQGRKHIRFDSVLTESLKLLQSSLPSTIDIKHNIIENCPAILADPIQMRQLITNICTNAGDAMRKTGGTLTVNLETTEINSTSKLHLANGTHLKLTISDTGCGMDNVTLRRIFEPFFTTKTQNEKTEGIGLGLSVAHGIITSHGGDITVSSTPGQGTTFTIFLPIAENQEIIEKEETIKKDTVPWGKERILFVDDEKEIALMTQQMLESLGYKITIQTNSVEALKMFQSNPENFDVIISDQTMPNMTGVHLAKEIMNIRPEIPVIIATGFSEVITEENYKNFGISEYVMKPLVAGDLSRAIRRTIDKK